MKMRDDLGAKIVDDELLILDKSNEKIHQLNETARFVWIGIEEGQTTEEIAGNYAKKFDISEEKASEDVALTINQFVALRLLEVTEPE